MYAQQLVAPRTFAEVQAPRLGSDHLADGEVLLRVLAGAICGSDLPVFNGVRTLKQRDDAVAGHEPGSPMHEVVGEVVASRDERHRVGDLVVGWGSRLNALAELAISLGDDLLGYDDRLSPEHAVMLQPLACVLYAVDQVGDVAGARTAVLGQGPMGLLFNHVLRSSGAREVVGVDLIDRTAIGTRLGAHEVVHQHTSRWASGLSAGERPDVVVEAVGHNTSTLGHALEAAAPSGRVLYFGVPDDAHYPIDMRAMLRKNLTLTSGITLQRRTMLARAGAYLESHPGLRELFVTDTFSVGQAQEAFELAVAPTAETAKITVRMAS
ncbi:zinc-binding dehydrogenase [Nocardioides albidus]|uniref:Zinc-binding dehydrogenase n=2 Tax=Nocardioides albidus TaxID=1517589 RepID=A0A5C4WRM4_9ACTN|nr:zinc-binding dehydrogenase [Nocardioides albidus]